MKYLDAKIINTILYRLPNIKKTTSNIYYNNKNIFTNTDNKYIIIKPYGKIAYIWFTYYEKQLLSILIILNNNDFYDKNNTFYNLELNFDIKLSYNNVLIEGTLLKENNLFVINRILNYNIFNDKINSKLGYNLCYKLELFHNLINIFSKYTTNNFKILLPFICNNTDYFFKNYYKLNYKIFGLDFYDDNSYLGNNRLLNFNDFNKKKFATFLIKPHLEQDIYLMYVLNNNKEEFYSYAYINSYKTSIFMNSIFRNIKENVNLDYLEESDSDEEFEDISIDKYLKKKNNEIYSEKIYCEYNNYLKVWIPIKKSFKNPIDKYILAKILKN